MSYCRWSDDDCQCDVYVYANCSGGYTTHVASRRVLYRHPLPPPVLFDGARITEWQARRALIEALFAESDKVPIGLPHDGESFNDDTASECADRLERLRALGYVVPQYAIDALREEA